MVFLCWIIFDTAIAVRMAFVNPEYGIPIWECVAWGLGGLAIGIWAFFSERGERKEHKNETTTLNNQLTELRTGQTFQSGQLNAITGLLGPDIIAKLAESLSVNLAQPPEQIAQAVVKGLATEFEALRSQNEELELRFTKLESLVAKPEPDDKRIAEIRDQVLLTVSPQQVIYRQQQARSQATRNMRMRAIAAALNLSTEPVASTTITEVKDIPSSGKKADD